MADDSDLAWYVDRMLGEHRSGEPPLIFGRVAQWRAYWCRRLSAATGEGGTSRDETLLRAGTQGFVLRTGQLDGLAGRSSVRTAVRHGRWYAPARGVVSPLCPESAAPNGGPAPDSHEISRRRHALDSAAAVLIRPGFVISGRSAAIVDGLPTMSVPEQPELTALSDLRLGSRDGANVRGAALAAADVGSWFGAPVTTVSRTLVDLARHDRRDAIMAADAALHEQLVDQSAIGASLAQAAGWPGVRQARDVLAVASPLAESPLESLCRLALRDSEFPPPELQVVIRGDARRRTYRVDMLWRHARLVLEIDGRVKYSDGELWREKAREQRLVALGYRVVRVTWDDVVRHWPETAAQLRAALGSC